MLWLEVRVLSGPTTHLFGFLKLRASFRLSNLACANAIQSPVYAVGGWTDGYKNAIPRLLERLAVPRKGLIGPWAHGYPHFALPGPQIGFLQETLRWWDYWLKGIDTGVMDEPILRAWMTESIKPASHHEA
jgi:predicted acyl esterase